MKKEAVLNYHTGGKIGILIKKPIDNRKELSLAYTPGVSQACLEIKKAPATVYDYTIKGNCVAIVTDGSRVLGLGNIGARAAIPVMEGKAMLFKKFANVDAFPICIETQDQKNIIDTVKQISPIFGAINLEDIETPKCFAIEDILEKELDIPVFHDDQHGTATAILAGLINAAKLARKKIEDLKIVINGAGAAGLAAARLLQCIDIDKKICNSVSEIILCDTKGTIYHGRSNLNKYKREAARHTNPHLIKGNLKDALQGADVFIGLSTGNVLKPWMIKRMAKKPIIFALSNPIPEIDPVIASKAGAFIVATGRSDFPNQINNAIAFPGIYRGTLDARAKHISKLAILEAARAISRTVKNPSRTQIIPTIFDKNLHKNVAKKVREMAATKRG